jgi:geranylgeranyl diphosphate synthase type I
LLHTLAYTALPEIKDTYAASVCLEAIRLLNDACIQLTRGQYLDLAYEKKRALPINDYWIMIGGKTAALLGFCTAAGGLLCGCADRQLIAAHSFGYQLGLGRRCVNRKIK